MTWTVLEHPDFAAERERLSPDVQDKLASVILALQKAGPQLGRPHVDTLEGSRHKKMKEIRFSVGGAWRFAFAFDEERNAIVLCGGNKEGIAKRRFYKQLIDLADKRFDDWLGQTQGKEADDDQKPEKGRIPPRSRLDRRPARRAANKG